MEGGVVFYRKLWFYWGHCRVKKKSIIKGYLCLKIFLTKILGSLNKIKGKSRITEKTLKKP